MILYFSATGNSAYVANQIQKTTNHKILNLFERIRDKNYTELTSQTPWVIVSPTYSWRIPRILETWLENTQLSGSKDIYFVMTCGGDNGNAKSYLKKLANMKKLNFKGCLSIVMPENYIALFSTPDKEESLKIIEASDPLISQIAKLIRENKTFPEKKIKLMDHITSGFVNQVFYPLFVHGKKFAVTESCISCGKCANLCPLKNIEIVKGHPVWNDNCTHCMACISHCPVNAIEYGNKTKNRHRYVCPK